MRRWWLAVSAVIALGLAAYWGYGAVAGVESGLRILRAVFSGISLLLAALLAYRFAREW